MKRLIFTMLIFGLLLGGLLLFGGCGEKSPTEPEEVTEQERERAEFKVTEAEGQWTDALVTAQAREEFPDFAAANASYKEALESDPDNLEANFGAALTEVLTLLSDPDIQALMDCLDALGVMDTIEIWSEEIEVPNIPNMHRSKALGASRKLLFKMVNTSLSCPPLVHEIQDILETKLIPRINYALERLAVIERQPNFQYFLPPRMTGEADSIEIDLGEVYVLDASLNIAKSQAYILIAYELDFDDDGSYDFLEEDMTATRQIKYLLEDSPTFWTLKPGNKMGLAKQWLLAALDKAEASLTFIRRETDDQGDDVIKMDYIEEMDDEIVPNDPEAPNFVQAFDRPEDIIAEIQKVLNGSYTLTEDFDDEESTPDQTITVNLSVLFDDPIQDFRKLLPYHKWEPESQWGVQDTVWYEEDLDDSGQIDDWERWYEIEARPPFYFTDASGNRLDMEVEDFFPIFPDYTFGGLFPGMTREEFEELLPRGDEEEFAKPLAKRRKLLSLGVLG